MGSLPLVPPGKPVLGSGNLLLNKKEKVAPSIGAYLPMGRYIINRINSLITTPSLDPVAKSEYKDLEVREMMCVGETKRCSVWLEWDVREVDKEETVE